jgi:DNA-binding transcriptional LysR family regulator
MPYPGWAPQETEMAYRGRLPNLNHLKIFERVAAAGNASRAAQTVNRSPPTVALAIRKLEAFFDAALLERGRGGSHATEAGHILLARVHRLFDQIDDALLHPLSGPAFVSADKLPAMRAKISFALIRGLIAIAEHDNFQAAAKAVGLTRTSLYRIARDMERVLGRACFEHSDHGFGTNKAGTELARRLNLALREIELAADEIRIARGVVSSRIAIGVRRTCAMKPLGMAVKEFLARYPDAHVHIADGPHDRLLHDLRHGRIDMIYGSLRGPERTIDLGQEAFFYDPYSIVVRAGHPLTRKRRVARADLAGYDWIVPIPGSPRRLAFERLFDGMAQPPTSSIETSSPEFKLTMLAVSDCITLMTRREVREHAAAGVLTTIDYAELRLRPHDGITTRLGWHPTPTQMQFVGLLRDHARNGTP